MRKYYLRVGFAFSILILAAAFQNCSRNLNGTGSQNISSISGQGFVRQSGTQIVDENGNPILLKGVNLGGWLIWDGVTWGAGLTSQDDLSDDLTKLLGADPFATFQTTFANNFITASDISAIAASGFNTVRVPFSYLILENDLTPYTYKDTGWAVLDALLSWAENSHVYVILDLQGPVGGANTTYSVDPATPSLWDSPYNQSRTASLWQAIATRYSTNKMIAGYDLIDAPVPPSGSALISLYQQIIGTVRAVDRNHMIFLEGGNYAQDFSMFSAPLDNDMAYSFHMYEALANRASDLAQYTALSQAQGVPLWNGEFGETDNATVNATIQLFENPTANVSGWTFWTWKESGEICPGVNKLAVLNQINMSTSWTAIATWMCDKTKPKPTAAQVQQGISDFEAAILLNATVQNAQLYSTLSQ